MERTFHNPRALLLSITVCQEKSLLHLMISLCPGCHAKVSRTRVVLSEMPPLLLELWREQHPHEYEQTMIDFTTDGQAAQVVPLALSEDLVAR